MSLTRSTKKNWIIKCKNDDLFWNNLIGWVDVSSADVFNQREKNTLNLPIEGQWQSTNNPDYFSRV